MSFPDQLKLGKFPYPALVRDLNKKLPNTRGIIIFLYEDGALHTYAYGALKCLDYMASIQKLINMAGCIKYAEEKKRDKTEIII